MDHTFISYEDFGAQFFAEAVTKERVQETVASLAGRVIEEGPMAVGPGGAAKVTAHGTIADPVVTQIGRNPVAFTVVFPISLDLEVDLHLDKHRFHADIRVPVVLTARATDELLIVIDVEPPAKADLHVDVKAKGLGAKVLARIVDVEDEIRATVVQSVIDELDAPEAQADRIVDVRQNIRDSA